MRILESYAARQMASFGIYSEDVTSVDGQFAVRYSLAATPDCGALRDFATKAVSYSREVCCRARAPLASRAHLQPIFRLSAQSSIVIVKPAGS